MKGKKKNLSDRPCLLSLGGGKKTIPCYFPSGRHRQQARATKNNLPASFLQGSSRQRPRRWLLETGAALGMARTLIANHVQNRLPLDMLPCTKPPIWDDPQSRRIKAVQDAEPAAYRLPGIIWSFRESRQARMGKDDVGNTRPVPIFLFPFTPFPIFLRILPVE